MSGIFKGIKKVFKKVTKFVKRYWKEIIIAAAIVFTAGAAAGVWGAAAAGGAGAGAAGGAVAGAAGATAATTATAGAAAAGGTVFGAAGGAAALGVGGAGGALGMGGLAAGGALGAGAGGAFAGLAAGGAAAGTAAAAGGAFAAGSSGAAGGITTLPAVTVTAPAAAGGTSLSQTVGATAVSAGGKAAFSQAAAEVAPQSNMDLSTPAQTAAKGPMGKLAQGAKNMWGGLSSFEKVQLLATGVNMLSAATAKDPEMPLANQFYGRDKDNKGDGTAFDYDKAAGKMVPADTRFLAKPEVAAPVGVQTPAKSAVPDPFVQAPPRAEPRTQNFVPDSDESLKKRLDFVQKGYDSGDYSASTGGTG